MSAMGRQEQLERRVQSKRMRLCSSTDDMTLLVRRLNPQDVGAAWNGLTVCFVHGFP